jgi:lipoprotein-releasing system ATP-binding protein
MSSSYVLSCDKISKVYRQAQSELRILNEISFKVRPGETVSITGSSGSGKSTLLHILAGLDKQVSGEVYINDCQINKLADTSLCKLRNTQLGFIYQFHHLLLEFTALENILLPLIIAGKVITQPLRDEAMQLLSRLGLENRHSHYPAQLSGGERQRVAIARAIVHKPRLVFADEPTGNLDNHTSNQVLEVFLQLQAELQTSLVIVTHDMGIASKTQTKYRLHNGSLEQITI